jgi:acetoin utilization deacetylase AcuC-like enzyme
MGLWVIGPDESKSRRGVVPWTLSQSGARHPSQEGPERIAGIRRGLLRGGARAAEFRESGELIRAAQSTVAAVHTAEYLAELTRADAELPPGGPRFIGPVSALNDTPMVSGRLAAAWDAASSSCQAAELSVRIGPHEGVYSCHRPPGHHAGPDFSGGYCLLNNAAIAAAKFAELGIPDTVIIDLDYHLGNGTFACVESHPPWEYRSLHSLLPEDYPYHYPGDPGLAGFAQPPAAADYLAAWRELVAGLPAKAAVVLSLGFDGVAADPHGRWSLPPALWAEVGADLAQLPHHVVVVQEGGYNIQQCERSAEYFAQGFCR